VLNLIPLMPISGFEDTFKLFLESLLPVDSHTIFESIYEGIYDKRRGGLLSSAFLLSILFMGNGIYAIFGGFEESYHVEITRHFFKQYLYALAVGLLLSFILLLAVAGFIFFEVYVVSPTTGGGFDHTLLSVPALQYVFFVIISYVSSACLYYFGTAEVNTLRFFSPGAFMSCVLIVLTTFLFGLYIEYFSSYNKLYGSIGALLILMLYIWLNAIILLLGFELNAVLNKFNKKQ
jgi:membrane protein